MKKIVSYIYALALVICVGTTAMLAVSNHNVKSNPSIETGLASDGAFRDGLYLGKLAAECGQAPRRPAVGRWSAEQDRSMFAAGIAVDTANPSPALQQTLHPPSRWSKARPRAESSK